MVTPGDWRDDAQKGAKGASGSWPYSVITLECSIGKNSVSTIP